MRETPDTASDSTGGARAPRLQPWRGATDRANEAPPLARRLDEAVRWRLDREWGWLARDVSSEIGVAVEEEALAAVVRSAPEDMVARLVYADYLQEQGEELRAGFIRAPEDLVWEAFCKVWSGLLDQISRATGLRPSGWGHQLEVPHAPYLEFTVPGVGGAPRAERTVTCFFGHGFVEVVRCSAAAWVQLAEALLATHPVRRVVLTDPPSATSRRCCEESQLRWPGITFELGE